MPQAVDDFTITLSEGTDMVSGELTVYGRLDQLWRMVEHYKMTAPLAIRVIDNQARCVRTIRGDRHPAAGWQLADDMKPATGDKVEFPLTINAQDAKGNILKMKVRLAGS